MGQDWILLADSVVRQGVRTTFEFGRIESVTDWIAPLVVFAVLCWFVIGMYLLDCVELGTRRAILLGGLRILALLGLLAIYVQPQWKEQHDLVSNSQIVVMADTSQSMQRADSEGDSSSSAPIRRSDRVIQEMADGELIPRLRQTHDVHVYRFDQDDSPTAIATLPKIVEEASLGGTGSELTGHAQEIDASQSQLLVASLVLAAGIVCLGWYLLRKSGEDRRGAILLVSGTVLVLAAVSIGFWTFTGRGEVTVREILALPAPQPLEQPDEENAPTDLVVDWQQELQGRGSETRLGASLAYLLEEKRSGTLSGIIVLGDGQENAGIKSSEAASLAAQADVPIHCIGFGSKRRPQFVGIDDFAAPARAMPEDPFEVTAYLHSRGYDGRSAKVLLTQVEDDNAVAPVEDLSVFQEKEVGLGSEGENTAVKFVVDGIADPGRYAFELAVIRPGENQIAEESRQRFYVEVVLRKTKVLLIAGGPTRDYRFLRNMLYRDKSTEVDVVLQSAQDAISQDADNLLEEFPSQIDQLFDYDCIVAFDPDWTRLSGSQVDILSRWVADEAGGLIVIPSLVHAGDPVNSWIQNPQMSAIEDMYPVEFHERFAQLNFRRGSSEKAAAIELTREGMAAEFLRLDEESTSDSRIWDIFRGVYGPYPVVGPKAGATVYAHFNDPLPQSSVDEPIYMASHFYGAGRVFYLGSGEMWRLRRFGDAKFEQFYINLVRHVSQGRLLRGSRRGDVLLLEQSRYYVGDNVPIVAHLKDDQRRPLKRESVDLFVFQPDGATTQLSLKPDSNREGMYRGELAVRQRGDYRLVLRLPDSDEDPLSKTISVASSAAEDQRPERNDEVLGSLAKSTGGHYYLGFQAAMGASGDPSLESLLVDRTQITPKFGDIDKVWAEYWAKWMMFGVCGLLCLEWLLRRLLKLA